MNLSANLQLSPRVIQFAALVLFVIAPILAVSAKLDDLESGKIVYAKGNEFLKRVEASIWDKAATGDVISTGDELRTGNFGALAIVLRDETQIRLRRNSRFIVHEVRDGDSAPTTNLELISGAFWSRAQALSRTVKAALYRRPVVQIRTATSTIGIRGTDWVVSVDEATGTSRTVIISGSGEVSNAFGSVTLASGEEAIAEKGKAPSKRVIVDLKNRPLMSLEYHLDWRQLVGSQTSDPMLTQILERIETGDLATAAKLVDDQTTTSNDSRFDVIKTALLMVNSDFEKAKSLATKSIERFPNESVLHVLLGHTYLLTDQPQALLQSINNAIAIDSNDFRAWHLRGIYFSIVEPNAMEATASYQKALEETRSDLRG